MKFMKLILGLALVVCASVHADIGSYQFSRGGLAYNGSLTTNYSIVGNRSVTGGEPIIVGLSATSDALATTTGFVQTYRVTNYWAVSATNSVVTNYIICNTGTGLGSTNGIGLGSKLVIEHNPNGTTLDNTTWEMLIAQSVIAAPVSTNIAYSPTGTVTNYVYAITSQVPPTNNVAIGDNIYLCVTNGASTFPVGVASINYFSAGGLTSGQRRMPLLLTIGGGTNATINSVSAVYSPQ